MNSYEDFDDPWILCGPDLSYFAIPTSYTKRWDDQGVGNVAGSLWYPNCPSGYGALSDIFLHMPNDQVLDINNPEVKDFRCVDLSVLKIAESDGEFWDSSGSSVAKEGCLEKLKTS